MRPDSARAWGRGAKCFSARTSNMNSWTAFLTSWLLPWPVITPLPPKATSMLRMLPFVVMDFSSFPVMMFHT